MNRTDRIRIPPTQPRYLFEVDIPGAYTHAHDLPVVVDELLVCVGGTFLYFPDRLQRPKNTAVLVALDRLNGSERFRLEVPTRAFTGEITTSLIPTVRPDGLILLAVYQHDTVLSVFALAPDGRVLWEDQLYDYEKEQDRLYAVHLRAFDLSIKHWVSPVIGGPAQSYLVSWLYRQNRFARMEYRRPGQEQALWSKPEWLVGACGEIVFGATVPREHSSLTARDLTTGKPLWAISGRESIVAAAEAEFVVLVYRPPTREEAAETAPRAAGKKDIEWAMAGNHCPPIIAREPATGESLWSIAVPGYVVSLMCGPDHVCVMVVTETGRPALLCADRLGQTLWLQELRSFPMQRLVRWGTFGPAIRPHWPVIVAVDAAHVLLETNETLTCISLRDGKEMWQVATPEVHPGFLPRVEDRILGRSTTLVQDGIIYQCEGTRLWAYTDREMSVQ